MSTTEIEPNTRCPECLYPYWIHQSEADTGELCLYPYSVGWRDPEPPSPPMPPPLVWVDQPENPEHPTWKRGWLVTVGSDGTGVQVWWRKDAFGGAWRYGELASLARQDRDDPTYAMAIEDLADLVATADPDRDYRNKFEEDD